MSLTDSVFSAHKMLLLVDILLSAQSALDLDLFIPTIVGVRGNVG